MKIIGFDFGTTNSIISFFNPETNALDCFKYDMIANEYIPSIISYKEGTATAIGNNAKANLSKKSYENYENFKLLLGKNFDKVIEGKSKSPIEVTTDYIRILLDSYIKAQNISEIDGIVMAVPETWFREAENRTARENIEKIYENLDFNVETQVQLESEPVAAAAYFCYAYENGTKSKYAGFLAVIDYGGGTLDVTLCSVTNGDTIKVLERCGYGEYNQTNGCAGVAFDEAVVKKLIADNNLPLKEDSKKFINFRNNFETAKILNTEIIKEMMISYYIAPENVEGEVIFTLDYDDEEINVYCKDLAECFEKVNAGVLTNSLAQIKKYFEAHNVDSRSQQSFKVLMVGGFSSFYCVEDNIRSFFDSMSGMKDNRFDFPFPFPTKNKSLAISQGAALIAQKVIRVDHVCTHSIGFIVFKLGKDYTWVPRDIVVIEKGMKISEVKEAKFSNIKIEVTPTKGALNIFLDDGRPNKEGRTPAALDQSLAELFPNINERDNEYQIGFSVNKNLIPTLHIKDKNGAETKTSLRDC